MLIRTLATLMALFTSVLGSLAWAGAAHPTLDQTLPNGLRVLVYETPRAPTALHMVWVKAGSIDETNGRTGLAHVLEHMMFKGTKTLAPGEFSRRVAALGGRENAFTSKDYTGYFQQIHKDSLREVMRLEADRQRFLKLNEAEFKKEIQVVMEERRLRTDDNPSAMAFEAIVAQAFKANPVRNPIIGWMNDLEHLTIGAGAEVAQDAVDERQLQGDVLVLHGQSFAQGRAGCTTGGLMRLSSCVCTAFSVASLSTPEDHTQPRTCCSVSEA